MTDKIIFEGITGSGKSTQIRLVKALLEREHKIAIADDISEVIPKSKPLRDILADAGNPFISQSLMFQVQNWLKLESLKEPYDILILDRFVLSNLVYTLARANAAGIKLDREFARQMILKPYGIDALRGTATIYLDCDASTARERVISRARRTPFDPLFQEDARRFYREEIGMLNCPYFVIDSSKDAGSITDRIICCIREVMK